jgi:hypothetical protein
VNLYLALGWQMIGLSTSQYMESTSMHYHLGWRASRGAPRMPPKEANPF